MTWNTYKICDVAKVITGKTPPGTEDKYFQGESLFVTPTDMGELREIVETQRTLSAEGEEVLSRVLFNRGIAVSCIGWQMGKSAIINRKAATNQQINTVLPDESIIDFDFLYYVLSSKRKEIFNLGATCTRTPILKKSAFEKISFNAPDLVEQQKIAGLLKTIDKKIELNREVNQTLEKIAQAIFKSWFVDFEPVKAKIEAKQNGRDPERTAMLVISGKSHEELDKLSPEQHQKLATVAAYFPSEIKKTDFGKLPKGWLAEKYDELYKEQKEKVKSRDDVYVLSAVQSGELKLPTDVFDKQVHSKDISKYKLVDVGDLAFNPSRINIGSAGFNEFDFVGAVSPVYSVMSLKDQAYGAFARMHLKLGITKEWINILCSGSVRQSLSSSDFLSIPVILPEPGLIKEFSKTYKSFEKQISANNAENITLESIRDLLLPRLLSGEIGLNDEDAMAASIAVQA